MSTLFFRKNYLLGISITNIKWNRPARIISEGSAPTLFDIANPGTELLLPTPAVWFFTLPLCTPVALWQNSVALFFSIKKLPVSEHFVKCSSAAPCQGNCLLLIASQLEGVKSQFLFIPEI